MLVISVITCAHIDLKAAYNPNYNRGEASIYLPHFNNKKVSAQIKKSLDPNNQDAVTQYFLTNYILNPEIEETHTQRGLLCYPKINGEQGQSLVVNLLDAFIAEADTAHSNLEKQQYLEKLVDFECLIKKPYSDPVIDHSQEHLDRLQGMAIWQRIIKDIETLLID